MPGDLNFDQKASKMGSGAHSEINRIYHGHCDYFNRLSERYSDRIIMLSFTLNAGGLAILIGYMGAIGKISLNQYTILSIIFFLIGIIFNVIVNFFEKRRFCLKGKKMD